MTTPDSEVAAWMESNGWIEHDNFWSLASDPWAKTTMSKKAAVCIYTASLKSTRDTLTHWASFFEDPSMNAMTPSERLWKAAATLTTKITEQEQR